MPPGTGNCTPDTPRQAPCNARPRMTVPTQRLDMRGGYTLGITYGAALAVARSIIRQPHAVKLKILPLYCPLDNVTGPRGLKRIAPLQHALKCSLPVSPEAAALEARPCARNADNSRAGPVSPKECSTGRPRFCARGVKLDDMAVRMPGRPCSGVGLRAGRRLSFHFVGCFVCQQCGEAQKCPYREGFWPQLR